jgi:hypothetical protein
MRRLYSFVKRMERCVARLTNMPQQNQIIRLAEPMAPRALTPLEWRGVVCCLLRRGLLNDNLARSYELATRTQERQQAVDLAIELLQRTLMTACFPSDAAELRGFYLVCHDDATDAGGNIPPMAMWAVELDQEREVELGKGMPDFDVFPFAPEL